MKPIVTTEDKERLRLRFLRSRWFLGLVGMCLTMWAVQAIHHAMQPKYEGKTIQEWFAIWQKDFRFTEKYQSVFQSLDKPALEFLWQEYNHKDSEITSWWMAQHQRMFKVKYLGDNHETHRRVVAYNAFCRASPAALEPFQPAIIARLKTIEPRYSGGLAYLLGLIPQQPETVIPALLDSLQTTNRRAGDRLGHLIALGKYGGKAAAAAPLLQTMLAETNRYSFERERLAIAITQISGPGPALGYLTNSVKFGNFIASYGAVCALAETGTNARPAIPLLHQLAHSLTNSADSNLVMDAIRKIDPEGTCPKP